MMPILQINTRRSAAEMLFTTISQDLGHAPLPSWESRMTTTADKDGGLTGTQGPSGASCPWDTRAGTARWRFSLHACSCNSCCNEKSLWCTGSESNRESLKALTLPPFLGPCPPPATSVTCLPVATEAPHSSALVSLTQHQS